MMCKSDSALCQEGYRS